jgi:hypothetical protein
MYDETMRLASGADVLVSHPLTFCTPAVATAPPDAWAGTILAPLSLFSEADFRCCRQLPAFCAG